jgi:hypothetical protein
MFVLLSKQPVTRTPSLPLEPSLRIILSAESHSLPPTGFGHNRKKAIKKL